MVIFFPSPVSGCGGDHGRSSREEEVWSAPLEKGATRSKREDEGGGGGGGGKGWRRRRCAVGLEGQTSYSLEDLPRSPPHLYTTTIIIITIAIVYHYYYSYYYDYSYHCYERPVWWEVFSPPSFVALVGRGPSGCPRAL